ncbi:MAG: sugar phosphate isomerase/epimerase family protein [Candidatus Methylacidiphilales bacterium]
MRLGGPLFDWNGNCDEWIAAARRENYTAVYSPFAYSAEKAPPTDSELEPFIKAAAKAGIVIAEVGAWSNPLDADSKKARAALDKCRGSLELAERLGTRSCVNITGSRSPTRWDGPHVENFSRQTFDMIVETTRSIVDAIKPTRTFYCLETMPWIFPSQPDQYLALLRAIDRPSVAVHLDPVNMINCPERAYNTAAFLSECFAKLGPLIKSCHAKDIILREKLTVHLDECRPGTGVLDYGVYLRELSRLDNDIPIMLEHLSKEEYPEAAQHLRESAQQREICVTTLS